MVIPHCTTQHPVIKSNPARRSIPPFDTASYKRCDTIERAFSRLKDGTVTQHDTPSEPELSRHRSALLTDRAIRLGDFRSVAELEAAITPYIKAANANPEPFRRIKKRRRCPMRLQADGLPDRMDRGRRSKHDPCPCRQRLRGTLLASQRCQRRLIRLIQHDTATRPWAISVPSQVRE